MRRDHLCVRWTASNTHTRPRKARAQRARARTKTQLSPFFSSHAPNETTLRREHTETSRQTRTGHRTTDGHRRPTAPNDTHLLPKGGKLLFRQGESRARHTHAHTRVVSRALTYDTPARRRGILCEKEILPRARAHASPARALGFSRHRNSSRNERARAHTHTPNGGASLSLSLCLSVSLSFSLSLSLSLCLSLSLSLSQAAPGSDFCVCCVARRVRTPRSTQPSFASRSNFCASSSFQWSPANSLASILVTLSDNMRLDTPDPITAGKPLLSAAALQKIYSVRGYPHKTLGQTL